MERVRQWLKLDELIEKERLIRVGMAQRAGLLPLILHSTFNHDIVQQTIATYSNTTSAPSTTNEPSAAGKNNALDDDET